MTTIAPIAERNASRIADHIRNRGLDKRVAVIAIMTAITESGIRVLANPYDPASMNLPHDGIGFDHDSAGIYQQRPPWGPVECRMNVECSTDLFVNRLLAENLTSITPWQAAQNVQISYDPTGENYHVNYNTAVSLVTGLWIPTFSGEKDMANIIARQSNGSVWVFEGGFAHHVTDPTSLQAYLATKQYTVASLTDAEIQSRVAGSNK